MDTTLAGTRAVEPQQRKKRRRGAYIKLSLAGLALLGIGAAATSAAWTDDAWFSATANAVTIELQGSTDATTFYDADDQSSAIVIPATAFQNLYPGVNKTFDLTLKNPSSTNSITVGAPVWTPDNGQLWAAPKPVVVSFAATGGFPHVIAAGGTYTVTMTAAPPAWTNSDSIYQGATGSGTVTFTAS